MQVKVKRDVSERVALFISPNHRDKLNELALNNHRGQRNQAEFMIDRDYNKLPKITNN